MKFFHLFWSCISPLIKGSRLILARHIYVCIDHFYQFYFREVVCKGSEVIQHLICSLSFSLTGEYVSIWPPAVSTDFLQCQYWHRSTWNYLFMIFFFSIFSFLCGLTDHSQKSILVCVFVLIKLKWGILTVQVFFLLYRIVWKIHKSKRK